MRILRGLACVSLFLFSGPWAFNLDFTAGKITRITERQSVEIRMEASNFLNHTTWNFGDQSVTSTNVGRITGSFFGRRLIQFGLTYKF